MSIKKGYREPMDLFKYDKKKKREHKQATALFLLGIVFVISFAVFQILNK